MRARAWVLFAAVSTLSGSAYLFITVAVEELSPVLVGGARAALGAVLLAPIALRRGALRGLRARLRPLLVLGCLEFAAPFVLLGTGTQRISSSLTGVLMAAGPLFIALLALRLDASERVSGLRLVGLIVGMAGTVCLLGLEVAGSARELLGAGLVLSASCSFSLGALYFKRHFSDVSPLGVVTVALAFGALLSAVPAAFVLPARPPSSQALAAVGVLGIAHAALNYLLFFTLVWLAGAGRATVTSYVAPAVAVVLGVMILGEPIGAGLVAGLLLIIAGSWLATGGTLPPGLAAPFATEAPRRRRPADERTPRRRASEDSRFHSWWGNSGSGIRCRGEATER